MGWVVYIAEGREENQGKRPRLSVSKSAWLSVLVYLYITYTNSYNSPPRGRGVICLLVRHGAARYIIQEGERDGGC